MTIFNSIIIFLIGLAVGSFLNALVYRLHEKKSLLERSRCPKCGAKICWYDNMPLVSFLLLRGRCRHCKNKISWQYPTVELVTAFLLLLSYLRLSPQFIIPNSKFIILIFRDWLMIFTGLFIFLYDLKYLEVEERIVLPAAFLILIFNVILDFSFIKMIWATIIGVGFFALQYVLTRGRGIGLGDLWIGFFMAASLSWPKILVGLFLSYLIGALVASILLAFKKKKLKDRLPLGPFLIVGAFLAFFFGEQILQWYLML